MSRPKSAESFQRFVSLPRLPIDSSGPVFQEPWQAQAFALAVHLHSTGAFSWSDWAAALAAELKAADMRGDAGDGSHYYEYWLKALESLVAERGLASAGALIERKAAWAEAYRRTPHGHPVEL